MYDFENGKTTICDIDLFANSHVQRYGAHVRQLGGKLFEVVAKAVGDDGNKRQQFIRQLREKREVAACVES